MIENYGTYKERAYYVVCDSCGEELGPFDTWEEARHAKEEPDSGFSSHIIDGEWQDLCTSCAPKTNYPNYDRPYVRRKK